MSASARPGRSPSAVDAVAEAWCDRLAETDPGVAILLGRPIAGHGIGAYAPEDHDARAEAAADTLTRLRATAVVDEVDAVTAAELSRSLRSLIAHHVAGWHLRQLDVIDSAPQRIRHAVTVLAADPRTGPDELAMRLRAVPSAIDGLLATLRAGARAGILPSRRQIAAVAHLEERHGGPTGAFAAVAARSGDTAVMEAARCAQRAYLRMAAVLRSELLPGAAHEDRVGRDLYALRSEGHLGTRFDPDEAYEWALDLLARVVQKQERVAKAISDGIPAAVALLDADPSTTLRSPADATAWLERATERSIDAMSAAPVSMPAALLNLEARIDTTRTGGGASYAPPSADLARPGRMTWPWRADGLSTWRELTTVFHEGIPGHHLQMGGAAVSPDLNTWRRLLAGSAGHSEGWALYAEQLMVDLGHLESPAELLGMLDAQRLRAARVVIDIGLHLGLRRPDGTGTWDADYAEAFLATHTQMPASFVALEIERYLGWPGQASAYAVGMRSWLEARDSALVRGATLKGFHDAALAHGNIGLETLSTLAREGRLVGSQDR